MKCLPKILMSLCAGAGVLACVNQSPDLEDCEKGLRLLFNWVSSAARSDTGSLNVSITGNACNHAITSPTTGRDIELLPGTYDFIAWENATNVNIDGTTVTVSSSDGVADQPQEFTAGIIRDEVLNTDDYQEVTVPMYQQTRDLIIRMSFVGDGAPHIAAITGTVDGIALSRDIIYGFPPVDGRTRPVAITSGSIPYTFAVADDGWYTGRRTLLGIDGEEAQVFTVRVGFDENLSVEHEITLTADFNGFHTQDVGQPWVISLLMEIGLSLDMEIIDWTSGTDSWLVAE